MSKKLCKTQYVTVRLVFDKPVTAQQAARLFADSVYGQFYPDPLISGDGPERITIGKVIPAGPLHAT